MNRPALTTSLACLSLFVALSSMSYCTLMPHGRRFTRHISVDDVKALEMWNNHRVTSETEISRWRDLGAWCRAYGEGGIHVGMTMTSMMPERGGGGNKERAHTNRQGDDRLDPRMETHARTRQQSGEDRE